MSFLVELIIAVALIALLMVYFNRDLFLAEDDEDDNSPPLIGADHPMRIKSRREFDALIGREQDTIIFVGAPWCGFCHSAIRSYIEAAEGHEGTAFVLEVKGKELSRLAQDIGVDAFPAILKSHRDGTRSKYSGERTTAGFREYLNGGKPTDGSSNGGSAEAVNRPVAESEPAAQLALPSALPALPALPSALPAQQAAQQAAPHVTHVAQSVDQLVIQSAAQSAQSVQVTQAALSAQSVVRFGELVASPLSVVLVVLSADPGRPMPIQ